MSITSSKVSKNNRRLLAVLRAYASHPDRSISQPSLMDSHRVSQIDMLGNSIFSELIVYLRKLVHFTGITKSCKSSMLLSHSGLVTQMVFPSSERLEEGKRGVNIILMQRETKS